MRGKTVWAAVRGLLAVSVFCLALGSAAAQEAESTPAAEITEGVASATLARLEVDALPPAPAYLGLARLVYGPNGAGPVETSGGLTLFTVVSGTVVFRPVTTSTATPASLPTGAGEIRVAAGDQWVADPGTVFTSRNEGTVPAEALRVVVYPAAPPPSFSDGVRFDRLAFGVTVALPPGPAALELDRVTLVPGASMPARAGVGPQLFYVESGTALLTSPGVESSLAPGTSAFLQLGAPAELRGAGDAPLVLLVVSVVSTSAESATSMLGPPAL